MQLVILIFCALLNVDIISGGLSGFYVDSGFGQTVIESSITNDDKQSIEHEILQLLGLPERPTKRNEHISIRKSAPQFLLNIYEKLTDGVNSIHSRHARSIDEDDEIPFTEVDSRAIDQSDIIMTFLNKNHHVPEVRHEKGRRLWFDVSEAKQEVEIIMAELRLYVRNELSIMRNNTGSITIIIYSIDSIKGESDLVKISETTITAHYGGWIEFDITPAVLKWTKNQKSNKGIYIGAYLSHNLDREIKLDDIGLINTKGDDKYQPFLVAYCKGAQTLKPVQHVQTRNKRSIQKKRKTKTENKNPLLNHQIDHHKSCQIKTLYVSFRDLNWQDWIIAPEGYNAFYCSGECSFPLNAHMNATNHAIVQTLVHLMHPGKVPKPCCAPTKLIPISVLYHIDEANVNLKKYKNMVVKSCGCH
ncbi:protein 60A-like [Uranotaenia lowii]|uniref:protein 60A-like n=1 Tax=Uranotaenia lowii TaxID=190385 RepID=UPI002478665E|nr:protein 60A-like [Uranotaenia lowii]